MYYESDISYILFLHEKSVYLFYTGIYASSNMYFHSAPHNLI